MRVPVGRLGAALGTVLLATACASTGQPASPTREAAGEAAGVEPAQTLVADFPRCRAAQLTARVTHSGSVMAQPFLTVTLRNRSDQPCQLRGYPFVRPFGHKTGSAGDHSLAGRNLRGPLYERSDPGPSRVDLPPGAIASFHVGTATAFSGGHYALTRLAITLPGLRAPLSLPVRLDASSPGGAAIPLRVTALAAGSHSG